MKTSFVTLALALLSLNAQADDKNIVCRSPNVADAGYTIVIDENRETAKLSEETFAGMKDIGEMKCERVAIPMNRGADTMSVTLECRLDRVGGGMIARLSEGGFWFHRAVTLTSYSFTSHGHTEHDLEFGALTCAQ